MKIVVLDGFTMNPGDLSWQPLQQLGNYSIFDRTLPDKIIDRCDGAEIVITNKVVFSNEIIEQLPVLKYIGVSATGYNVVDMSAAKNANIVVTNVPAYSTMSVAQMVFAHILNFTHHVAQHSDKARKGKWAASEDFAYWDFPLIELADLTLGVIGFGKIGNAVAEIALAFGMNVIFYDKNTIQYSSEKVQQVDLETVFTESDFLSLHCPLTDETYQLINTARLSTMKATAYLINTSRGPLVNERALADALDNNRLAGAGIDVMAVEPPHVDNPLLAAKNCTITPHIAWATKAARQRLMDVVVENVKAFIKGRPQNVVN